MRTSERIQRRWHEAHAWTTDPAVWNCRCRRCDRPTLPIIGWRWNTIERIYLDICLRTFLESLEKKHALYRSLRRRYPPPPSQPTVSRTDDHDNATLWSKNVACRVSFVIINAIWRRVFYSGCFCARVLPHPSPRRHLANIWSVNDGYTDNDERIFSCWVGDVIDWIDWR